MIKRTIILLSLFVLPACTPEAKRHVSPEKHPVIYIIPDWDIMNRERDELAATLLSPNSFNIFLTPVPAGLQGKNTVGLPEKSFRHEFPGFSVYFLILAGKTTYLPLDELRNPDEEESRPSIAICKGSFDEKTLARIDDRLGVGSWVFIDGRYEQKEDIKGIPAASTGCDSFDTPFTGYFPHILRIDLRDRALIRPVDIDGYLLSPDEVTSQSVFQIKTLTERFDLSFNVENWHKGEFTREKNFEFINPFPEPLLVSLLIKKEGPWNIRLSPSSLLIQPGRKGSLCLSLSVESVDKITPFPEFSYSLTVGKRKAASGNIPVDIHRIKAPE